MLPVAADYFPDKHLETTIFAVPAEQRFPLSRNLGEPGMLAGA